MPAENEESTDTPNVEATDTEETSTDETPDETPDEAPGEPAADDESANANAMIEQLNGTIEGLNMANEQLQTEQAAQIQELQGTITGLRAELWTATRVLPNDSVSTDTDSESDDTPATFDDLVAKATAKESD